MSRRTVSVTPSAVLLGDVRTLIEVARQRATSAVNSELTMLYWRIGLRIHTQVLEGRRADYGEEVVPTLAKDLVKEYGSSFSVKNLRRMVQFAVTFPDEAIVVSLIRQLSWTHFIALIPLKDPHQRDYYAQMASAERWSVRTLRERIGSMLYDKGYLIVDGTDGKAHYVALPPRTELEQYPTGAVVEVKGSNAVRVADKTIAALAVDGLYRTDHHLAVAKAQPHPGRHPHEVVEAHIRRLEALRRAGLVERQAEGVWKVPQDLPERGRQYDAQRLGGVAVELKSHLPIERQARVIGATWLDQQLIGGGKGLGDFGFGSEVKEALQQRGDFLAEQGLAEKRGQRVILARNLLATLRNRELTRTAQDIAAETGLEHRPVTDGQRVAGIYRRNVMLASGRYAMLDDGMGFSLVPWRPVIEQRLGKQLAATVRGGGVSWETGRQRGPSIG